MKKAFPIALILIGFVFLAAGGYTVYRGVDAKDQVRDELVAQKIMTPDDAAIPGVLVSNAAEARAMAEVIETHALEATGGLTYAEMGRFMAANGDPAGTSDEAAALTDPEGNPIPNQLRNVAFQASTLQTSLYTSVMAFNVAELVVGLGLMIGVLGLAIGGLGVALGGLAIPALSRRLHVDPVAAEYHPVH